MRDFTKKIYKQLLERLLEQGYIFLTFRDYLTKKIDSEKFIILCHDVDLKPQNSLATAEIESALDICSTYFFRIIPASFDEKIIKHILQLEHEIGYHYENLSICRGNVTMALEDFRKNLTIFQQYSKITSISSHGSPLSKWDNREIWQNFDYKSLGILGDPHCDTDFSQVTYLTDTGRMWDGNKVSVRDKIDSPYSNKYHTTLDIIQAVESNNFPSKIMINTHPQRWNDNIYQWSKELLLQKLKNNIKKIIVNRSSHQ